MFAALRAGFKVNNEGDDRFEPNRLDSLDAETMSLGSVPYLEWPQKGPRDDKDKYGFCALHGDAFRVRSASYVSSRVKHPAGDALMQPIAMDWFKSSERTSHVAGRKGSVCRQLLNRTDVHQVLAVVIQFPSHSHYTLVSYFASRAPVPEDSLLGRWLTGSDAFRKSRIKLIPRVMEGAWVAQRAVGTVPVLLGKALELNFHGGDGYLEMDVNIGSCAAAHKALQLVMGYAANLVIDFAWVIEGRSADELPERLLGNTRVAYLREGAATAPPPEDY